MAAVRGLMFAQAGITGVVVCGREFMNSLDESSMAEVKAAIASEPWLAANYDVGEKYIRTKCGRVSFAFIGLRRNLASIKSKARILILWVDEAEEVSEYAWELVDPTVREEGSEVWVTWNPERRKSATNKRFRLEPPPRWKGVEMNWSDNEFFPETLNRKRETAKKKRPDTYGWIWEGEYRSFYDGAYFAEGLRQAKDDGRIGVVPIDRSMTVRTYHDLAGGGDKADFYAIWVCQFVGKEIRVLDHYEAQGQSSSYHINWLRNWAKEKRIDRISINLPHDGAATKIDFAWREIWEEASDKDCTFDVDVIPNQGKGAAMIRVDATRDNFDRIWFNDETTVDGREALSAYHEKRDEDREVGLGPNHNWASHSADAFGLMCCDYKEPANVSQDIMKGLYGGAGRGSAESWTAS